MKEPYVRWGFIAVLLLAILGGVAYFNYQMAHLRRLNSQLQNQLATFQSSPIVVSGDTLGYQKYAELVGKVSGDVGALRLIVQQQNLKLHSLVELQTQMLLKIDSVKTEPIGDSARAFDKQLYDGGVRLKGRFQLHDPYLLFVDTLSTKFSASVSIARNSEGALVSTLSNLPPYVHGEILRTQLDKSVTQSAFSNPPKYTRSLYVGPFIGRFSNRYTFGSSLGYSFFDILGTADFFSMGWGISVKWKIR